MKKKDLNLNTGKDGNPAYILYKGKIYDVTKSKLWAGGIHMSRHKAGEDLTDFMAMAPHGEEVFEKVEIIGELENEFSEASEDKKDSYRDFYRKFHPHPLMIHFPVALFIFGALTQIIFLLWGNYSFEKTAYYSLIFAGLTSFPAIFSGLFSWWINYDLTMTKIFRNKLIFSALLIFLSLSAVILRTIYSDISFQMNSVSVIYNFLLFLAAPVTIFIAYYGGKITWPS